MKKQKNNTPPRGRGGTSTSPSALDFINDATMRYIRDISFPELHNGMSSIFRLVTGEYYKESTVQTEFSVGDRFTSKYTKCGCSGIIVHVDDTKCVYNLQYPCTRHKDIHNDRTWTIPVRTLLEAGVNQEDPFDRIVRDIRREHEKGG